MIEPEKAFQAQVEPMPDRPEVSFLRVRGNVRFDDAPRLREWLLGEVAHTPASVLVVSLGGVETMSSAGVAVLIEGLLASRDRGLRMLLCGPSDSVLQTFRLAGLSDALEVCCREEEVEQKVQELVH
jgi:anti-anti-sigma factor